MCGKKESLPKIQSRNIPECVYEKLVEGAQRQERSLEGHIRYILSSFVNGNCRVSDADYFPEWLSEALKFSAKQGFRSVRYEMIKRLTESFERDGINSPDEKANNED